jgi:hypothetical protein
MSDAATPAGPRVVAFVPDLMDRSRCGALGARFVRESAELADLVADDADVVVVDLSRAPAAVVAAELAGRGIRVVGFAPHVQDDLRATAAAAGVVVLARSRFFSPAGIAQVLGNPNVQPPSV